MKNIETIIKEVVDQWFDDEPSILDKYFDKKVNNYSNNNDNKSDDNYSGTLLGYLTKKWSTKLNNPVPVFKNPTNLRNYNNNARGVLVDNGDVYVSPSLDALHLNIIELLVNKNIIPASSYTLSYGTDCPEEYITVVRQGNNFTQSTAYDDIPDYYEYMFQEASKMHPFKFIIVPTDKIIEN